MKTLCAAAAVMISVASAYAGGDAIAKCQGQKMKASGKNAFDKAKCQQAAISRDSPVDPACLVKADAKLTAAITKAGNDCAGEAQAIQGNTNALLEALLAEIREAAPCPGWGKRVAGHCWYTGKAVGEDCNAVCGGPGLVYDQATETYAGSGGTDDNCKLVLSALGAASIPFQPGIGPCSAGFGCGGSTAGSAYVIVTSRCSAPPTDAYAADQSVARVCACQAGT